MISIGARKTDQQGYDEHYCGAVSELADVKSCEEYTSRYESYRLAPFYAGGITKGCVRGAATNRLLLQAERLGLRRSDVNVLDAGCGQGELSVYLACKGFNVIGVDISAEGCRAAQSLAQSVGVSNECTFRATSLESIPIDDNSIDFIIGHAALHHFIKYEGVPREFMRVMKQGATGYFADAFGENKLYHVFHDKEKMKRLGDVSLTRPLIMEFFKEFEVELIPVDWFAMLDKLYLKVLSERQRWLVRKLAYLNYWLDRHMPVSSRMALFLSGSLVTVIKNA